VAGDDLIASYARELSDRLGGRAGTIAAEAFDHLLESVDERIRQGVDRTTAERGAIAAFGSPSRVAASYVAGSAGLPTRFTRTAGWAALMAAGLVAGGVATIVWANIVEWSQPWDALPRTLWSIGNLAIMAGVMLSAVGAAGLLRRQGRVSGWPLAAVTLLAVAAVAALVAWFVWLWVTALALGALILTARLLRADLAPRGAVIRTGLGPLLAVAILWFVVAPHSIGADVLDSDLVRVSVGLGLMIWASGVGSLGRWLLRDSVSAT
jgi:hypothetical protein